MHNQDIVFTRIFPNNLEALYYARERLSADHFHDKMHKTFWLLVEAYANKYNEVISTKVFMDRVSRFDPKNALVHKEMFSNYVTNTVTETEFKYAVDSLVDDQMRIETGKSLANSYEILQNGITVNGKQIKGHEEARKYLLERFTNLEATYLEEETQEGDLFQEKDQFLEAYDKLSNSPLTEGGIRFGLDPIDECIEGIAPGELVLIAAYTSHGKTQLASQLAWYSSYHQGKNVIFFTSETVRNQVACRIIARHSREPQFGISGGMNSKSLLKGTLSSDEREVLSKVMDDLHESNGRLNIIQLPSQANLAFIEGRIRQWAHQIDDKVDLVIIDSINLLNYTNKNGEREGLNDLLRKSKSMATGLSVPIVSPWQISRNALDNAINSTGEYYLSALSDTSEAEKSSSIIVTLLKEPDTVGVQVMKNRDGVTLDKTPVNYDYRNSYFGTTPTTRSANSSFMKEVAKDFDSI